ncbi:MAG: polyphosphate polymerase domain-containing protein [Planctomycetota bacterium]
MSDDSNQRLDRIELKFRLEPGLSKTVRDWAKDHLERDPNCHPDSGDTYAINTLYFDTADRDIFHQTKRIGMAKHRVRRYAGEQTVWLETKRKKNVVVRKKRTAVSDSDYLARSTNEADDAWRGDWFLDRVSCRGLEPAIQISYQRFARVATIDGRPMRLTIDSEINAGEVDAVNPWTVTSPSTLRRNGVRIGREFDVLELKFHGTLPPLFKKFLQTFVVPMTSFSKYRTSMDAMPEVEQIHG